MHTSKAFTIIFFFLVLKCTYEKSGAKVSLKGPTALVGLFCKQSLISVFKMFVTMQASHVHYFCFIMQNFLSK